MYLTKKNINSLEEIITGLNDIKSEAEKNKFLEEHVEDATLLLKVLKKLNKSKMPKGQGKNRENNVEITEDCLYTEDQVYCIFREKSDSEILTEYSLTDLRQMYSSVYKKKPASSHTKQRIVSTLRNRLHTMNRTAAFLKLAEERQK